MRVTKVKGHATEQQVEEGQVTRKNKEGSDTADDAADKGVNGHTARLREFIHWLNKRHNKYTKIIKEVQAMTISVLNEQDEKRNDDEKTERLIKPKQQIGAD